MSNCADTLHLCSLVDCSLREAIASGDPGDTIEIPDGTYTLTLGSELTIDKSLTLNGAGSTNSTIIQAAASSADATHRVFLITGDNNVVAISGVIIRHGKSVSGGAGPENAGTRSAASEAIITGGAADYLGGGIRNNSMLTLADSTVGMNLADSGGGIFNEGTLNVDNSMVSNNTAVGLGGGIKNPGVLTVNNSNINENSAGGDGGGIFNFGSGGSSGPTAETTPGVPGTAHINDSTVSNNISGSFGGGISNSGGVVYVTSTTVSGNNAANDGGGIDNFHGTADLTSTTISGNSANNGGGISNFSATLSMINTISAGNTAPTAPDCTGTLVSLGHNLIGNTAGCGFTAGAPEAATGDLLDVNPKLGSLKDNGGPTKTHALLPGSPAIDSSDDSVLGPPHNLATDQRGFSRLKRTHVDIGAFEAPFTITKTGDSNDGSCDTNDCSLREAISSGDVGALVDIPAGVYTLTFGTELLIGKSLTLHGAGSGDTIIQAADVPNVATHRVLRIASGNNVVISDVTVRHGKAGSGGIYNEGTLSLNNTTVSANSSGGILNYSNANLSLTNSTVSGNSAGSRGGGIYNGGTVNFINTIIAGNSSAYSTPSPDCFGTLTSQGHNLVQDVADCTIAGDLTGNITGQDPFLGPLADNGGPTLTHALTGGLAIEGGDDSVIGAPHNLTTDQRGAGFARLKGLHVDIGAFEIQNPAPPDTLQTSPFTVNQTGDDNDGVCGVSDCHLREAVAAAATGDTINIPLGVYTLTQGTELLIDKSLTITGAGSGDSIIQAAASSADATSRVFKITSGNDVAISDVTIRNGKTSGSFPADRGGGIFNEGTLSVNNSGIRDSSASYGGGIANYIGTLTLTNSTVSGNSVTSQGGGIHNQNGTLTLANITVSANSAQLGAGIHHSGGGMLTLTNSTVSNNSASWAGGGFLNSGNATLTDSTFSGNTAAGSSGGGIYNSNSGGALAMTNSTVSGNTSYRGGGGIYSNSGTVTLANITVSGNTSTTQGGAGIQNGSGTLTLTNSTVSGNSGPGEGGGISLSTNGTVTVTGSTISGNQANLAGGISNYGTMTLTNITVSGNNADVDGGGIINNQGRTLTLTNCTVSGNTASGNGGGVYNKGTLILTNGTVSGNSASYGGGIRNTGLAKPLNAILAGNTASQFGPDCYGTLTSQGHNLVQDVGFCTISGILTGNITGQDPLLGPLADNGGPTLTHALLFGSPAIDSGDDSVVGSPLFLTTDQRGASFPRLQRAHVDIGAYEAAPPPDPAQTSPITVTKMDDTNDGFCGVADCSLKEAIGSGDSGDSINIPMGTYTLTLGTELVINKNLTLTGAGSGDSIIQAAASSADATSRVFKIASGNNVAVSDLTIRHGKASGSFPADRGGSILNEGTLSLNNSGVSDSSASFGGGISNNSGTLTLTNSTVSGNTATVRGGGIYNTATLTLTNSTISGNTSTNDGGGIYNKGTLTVANSTVGSNTATRYGGGIRNNGSLTLTDSTVSGNATGTGGWGGGIYNVSPGTLDITDSVITGNNAASAASIYTSGPTTVVRSTVSFNIASTDFTAGGIAAESTTLTVINSTIHGNRGGRGGIKDVSSTTTVTNSTITGNHALLGGGGFGGSGTFRGTIIAGNTANTAIGADCSGSQTSLGHNLIGKDDGCGFTPTTGDIVGTNASPVNPLLGALQDNGGPTLTHALLSGSPAIDSGDDSVVGSPLFLTTDQRGAGFPRLQGAHVDIGAYEAAPPPDPPQTSPITVTKTGDTNDGFCGVADCSLREAIGSGDSGDSIIIPMGTYTLTLGTELVIDKSLTLTGVDSGDTIIQAAASSADATSRVFNITGGTIAISDVTIRNGKVSASATAAASGT